MFSLKLYITLAAIVLFCFSATAIAQTWTSLNGPQIAKTVKDISISGDFVYIADSSSYLLKSTNGGNGWFVTGTPYLAPLYSLVKPDDATKVVTTKNVELRYSDDGGGSNGWQLKINDDNLIPLRLVAAVNDPTKMLLGRRYNITGTITIWWSQLGGSDWNPVPGFNAPTDINDFSSYQRTGDGIERERLIIAGGSAPSGSTPQGLSKSSPAINAGLWKSIDFGQTWEEFGLGNTNVRSVAIIPKNSNTPYIRLVVEDISGGNDIVSRDATLQGNWTTVFSDAAQVRMVRVKPSNNYVFLATSNGVYRSTTEGTADSWTQQNSGLGTDIDVITVAVTAAGNTILAGTPNSIYRSTDNGNTWTEVGKMNVTSIAAYSGTVWAGTRDNNYSGKFTGSSWTKIPIGDIGNGFSSEQVFLKSPTELFVAGALNNAAALYRSTNSGSSYFQVTVLTPLPTSGKFLGTVKNPGNNEMWLYGGGSINGTWRMLLKSTDNGDNWSIMSPSPYWEASGIYVNDFIVGSNKLFAVSSDGKVYRSDDNGVSWASPAALDMGVGHSAQAVALNYSQSNTVYAGGTDKLWKSTNSGAHGSWVKLTNAPNNIKRILMHPSYPNSSNHLWIIADNGNKIYNTTDGGSNWVEITNNLPKPINDLRRDPTNNYIIYCATVNGVYTLGDLPEAPVLATPLNGTTGIQR